MALAFLKLKKERPQKHDIYPSSHAEKVRVALLAAKYPAALLILHT